MIQEFRNYLLTCDNEKCKLQRCISAYPPATYPDDWQKIEKEGSEPLYYCPKCSKKKKDLQKV